MDLIGVIENSCRVRINNRNEHWAGIGWPVHSNAIFVNNAPIAPLTPKIVMFIYVVSLSIKELTAPHNQLVMERRGIACPC